MSFQRLIGILFIFATNCKANESIAIAFENWDFGHYNSHSYELLIVVILAILALTLLLLIISLLFKKFFDWLAVSDKYKTRDSSRQNKRKHNWMNNEEKNDEKLQAVIVQAELVRMQGDIIPDLDLMITDPLIESNSA